MKRYHHYTLNSRDVKKYARPSRVDQDDFKKLVIERYGEKCAFCKIKTLVLLEAAHIVAWADRGADIAEAGLVLCSLHHRALDSGLVLINLSTLVSQRMALNRFLRSSKSSEI
jgi:predicted restriction endonuclease